jgi:hypothetical protein
MEHKMGPLKGHESLSIKMNGQSSLPIRTMQNLLFTVRMVSVAMSEVQL